MCISHAHAYLCICLYLCICALSIGLFGTALPIFGEEDGKQVQRCDSEASVYEQDQQASTVSLKADLLHVWKGIPFVCSYFAVKLVVGEFRLLILLYFGLCV